MGGWGGARWGRGGADLGRARAALPKTLRALPAPRRRRRMLSAWCKASTSWDFCPAGETLSAACARPSSCCWTLCRRAGVGGGGCWVVVSKRLGRPAPSLPACRPANVVCATSSPLCTLVAPPPPLHCHRRPCRLPTPTRWKSFWLACPSSSAWPSSRRTVSGARPATRLAHPAAHPTHTHPTHTPSQTQATLGRWMCWAAPTLAARWGGRARQRRALPQRPRALPPRTHPQTRTNAHTPHPMQVVYILDQVRALEKEMRTRLQAAGLEVRAAGVG